jgi:hypothetical protein
MASEQLEQAFALQYYVCRWRVSESGSSGSIVSGYGLDDRVIGVRSPAEAKNFSSSLCVQTGSGAHPASCTMGTGGPFPGGKARPGRDADHSPHLVPMSRMSRSYTSSPSSATMVCSGTALLFRWRVNCKYIVYAIADSRQGVPSYCGFGDGLRDPYIKKN